MGPLLCVQHTMSIEEILPCVIQLLLWLSSKKTTQFIPSTVKQQKCSHDKSLLHSWLKARPWRRGCGGTEQDLPQTLLLTELRVFIPWPGGFVQHSRAQQCWQSTDWNCIASFTFRAVWDTDPSLFLPHCLLLFFSAEVKCPHKPVWESSSGNYSNCQRDWRNGSS